MNGNSKVNLGNSLLEIIRGDCTLIDWSRVYDDFVKRLVISENFNSLTKLQRLAVSIAIVGSRKVELYNLAFRILCEWEYLGGPHWVIQEEILRHICLDMISNTLEMLFPYKNKFFKIADKKLAEILPETLPSFITNRVLVMKINDLKGEFNDLLSDLMSSDDPKSLAREYANRTPLESFIGWFVMWGHDLINEVCPLDLSTSIAFSTFTTNRNVSLPTKRKSTEALVHNPTQQQREYDVYSIINHRPFSVDAGHSVEPDIKCCTLQEQVKGPLSLGQLKITIPDSIQPAHQPRTIDEVSSIDHRTPISLNSESTRSSCYASLADGIIGGVDDSDSESQVQVQTPLPWLGSISKVIWEFFEAGRPSLLGSDYDDLTPQNKDAKWG